MCVFQGWCVKSSEPCTLNIHSIPKEVIPGQVNVLGFFVPIIKLDIPWVTVASRSHSRWYFCMHLVWWSCMDVPVKCFNESAWIHGQSCCFWGFPVLFLICCLCRKLRLPLCHKHDKTEYPRDIMQPNPC